MPVTLTNLEAFPVQLEQYPIIGEYIQGGHGTETDYFNPGSKCILPGEPVKVFNRLGISKEVILPGTFGTLVFGAWVNFLLDPEEAATILQGDLVYFDLDLADSDLYVPGYASSAQPTNGYRLGYALGRHGTPQEVALEAGSPIAAAPGDQRIFVLMDQFGPTSYGTITDALSTS